MINLKYNIVIMLSIKFPNGQKAVHTFYTITNNKIKNKNSSKCVETIESRQG